MRALLVTFAALVAAGSGVAQQAPATRPSPATAATTSAALTLAQRNARVSELRERAAGAARRGEAAAAAELYLELMKLEPADPEWALWAGRTLGQAGRYNDALDALEGVRKGFGDALEIPALIARTYQLKAESMLAAGTRDANVTLSLESALEYAQQVLAKDPAHRDARLILGQSLYTLGEPEKAEAAAEEALRRFPDHPGGAILLGKIAFDRFAQAKRDAQSASGKEQTEALQRAATARDLAKKHLERAVALDPERAFPHVKLGDLEAWQGRVPQALEEYGKALAIDPEIGLGHGWIEQNAKDGREAFYAQAIDAYAKSKQPSPAKGATLVWYHGAALLAQKRWKEARQRFEDAVRANPTFQNSWYRAAHAAFWDGDHDGALENAVAYAAANAAGFADLLRSQAEADREEALRVLRFLAARAFQKGLVAGSRDLNHVIAFLDEKADSWNNYAFLCRETGKFQDSLDAYVHALELEPDSPQLLNDAAVILQYHLATPENLAKARGWYEKALASAEKILGDSKTTAEQRKLAQQAQSDARGNLAKLR